MTKEEKEKICLDCRLCCQYIGFVGSGAIAAFMETWGYEMKPIGNDEFAAILHHPCQHITEKGCAIYDRRPSFCRSYWACQDPALSHLCKIPLEEVQT